MDITCLHIAGTIRLVVMTSAECFGRRRLEEASKQSTMLVSKEELIPLLSGHFSCKCIRTMKAFTTQALVVGNSFLGIIICMISFSTWVLVVNLQNFPLHIMGKNISYGCGRGDYINLGAGAELGIYTGGEPHWHVDKRLAMTMYIELRYNGATIISHSDYTWWITGFNPKYQNKSASSLTAIFTIRFNDPGMYNAFRNSGHMGWKFGLMQGFGMATFIF